MKRSETRGRLSRRQGMRDLCRLHSKLNVFLYVQVCLISQIMGKCDNDISVKYRKWQHPEDLGKPGEDEMEAKGR